MRNRNGVTACLLYVAAMVTASAVYRPAEGLAQEAPRASDISEDLRKVIQANCEGNEKEDLTAALATIHPQSPTYASTEAISDKLFAAFDLKYELKSFRYLGTDETYAVGRAKVRTSSAGENQKFRNNTSDLMIVFRKDDDAWKVWSQSVLEITFE